ncbi:hypothetical protein [Mangrovicoccus sp. HB161399]|uniref:hypothetical protein n=1 Tax=Mangrovicoccus sp. HB161399 TaxID=2720392 RepID=UPI0015575443|nr:hypothetical protein [Mangrovicoccus sp. HB161399]
MRLAATLSAMAAAAPGFAATLEPASVLPSSLTLRITEVGKAGATRSGNNYASPAADASGLWIADQTGTLYRSGADGTAAVLQAPDLPSELVPNGREGFLEVAPTADGSALYVLVTSDTLPSAAVPLAELPAPLPGACCADGRAVDDIYEIVPGNTQYQILYRYTVEDGVPADPQPVTALEVQYGSSAHRGGAMAVLPDGRLLLATGDNLPAGTDGRGAPQDDGEHVGKLLLVDPSDGSITVAAKGVRNVQHLQIAGTAAGPVVVFGDIGGAVAEEVNAVPLADLLDTSEIENFGWGRAADGLAREGTFYISPGVPLGAPAEALSLIPPDEEGFLQAIAQIGRTDPASPFALSGPVVSDVSFDQIGILFADLVSGSLFATTGDLAGTGQDVFDVSLVDADGIAVTLLELSARSDRADPRFFLFADGSAGVLIESTATYYRLTEVAQRAAVPLPAGLLLLASALPLLLRRRRG